MDAIVADEIGSEPSWRIYIGLRGASITLEITDQRQSASVTVPSAYDMMFYRQSTLEGQRPFPASSAARALPMGRTDVGINSIVVNLSLSSLLCLECGANEAVLIAV